mmetsp:Transcript_59219/g.117331  ORF Transcript_59219/g.117331 Transcript_59219/m.117331 type:complete len:99 (+) Transcript_59219:1137-1433(+)
MHRMWLKSWEPSHVLLRLNALYLMLFRNIMRTERSYDAATAAVGSDDLCKAKDLVTQLGVFWCWIFLSAVSRELNHSNHGGSSGDKRNVNVDPWLLCS